MPKLFPQLDRLLSIDVDTIVQGDITELWGMDMTGYHIACAREVVYQEPYYNNGVCLMNLKQMREDGVDDMLIHSMNTTAHRYVTQDAMQTCCKIKELPSKYNACKFTEPCAEPLILHFADTRDWRGLPIVKEYET